MRVYFPALVLALVGLQVALPSSVRGKQSASVKLDVHHTASLPVDDLLLGRQRASFIVPPDGGSNAAPRIIHIYPSSITKKNLEDAIHDARVSLPNLQAKSACLLKAPDASGVTIFSPTPATGLSSSVKCDIELSVGATYVVHDVTAGRVYEFTFPKPPAAPLPGIITVAESTEGGKGKGTFDTPPTWPGKKFSYRRTDDVLCTASGASSDFNKACWTRIKQQLQHALANDPSKDPEVAFYAAESDTAPKHWRRWKLVGKRHAKKAPAVGPLAPDPSMPEQCKGVIPRLKNPKIFIYLHCIDMRNPAAIGRWVYVTEKRKWNELVHADPMAFLGHVYANHPVYFVVLHPPKTRLSVLGSAEVGRANHLFTPGNSLSKESGQETKVDPPKAPAASGNEAISAHVVSSLAKSGTVTFTAKTDDDKVAVSHTTHLEVERAYKGAVRLGLSMGWSPLEREYEIRGDARFIALDHGGSGGFPFLEFTAGYTIYASTVREFHSDIVFGWYFGLGVLGAGTSLEALTTILHTGPELVIGTDFSIALTFALRRGSRLEEGFQLGQSVASAEDLDSILQPTLFPAVGIVLNLSPDFFRILGVEH